MDTESTYSTAAADQLVTQTGTELIYLLDLMDELRPGAEGEPRWSQVNQAILLSESRRSIGRLNRLVARLRAFQQIASPELQERLNAALFAAEISVNTAGVAMKQLGQAPAAWQPEMSRSTWSH